MNVPLVLYLIDKHECDPCMEDIQGRNALHYVPYCSEGDENCNRLFLLVKLLQHNGFCRGGSLAMAKDTEGQSAFMKASSAKDSAAMRLMLRHHDPRRASVDTETFKEQRAKQSRASSEVTITNPDGIVIRMSKRTFVESYFQYPADFLLRYFEDARYRPSEHSVNVTIFDSIDDAVKRCSATGSRPFPIFIGYCDGSYHVTREVRVT